MTMKILTRPESGSIANQTASKGRAGQYRRTRAMPIQRIGSGRSAMVRGWMTQASIQWSSLTNAQRQQWTTWAEMHPTTDALGSTIVQTGHAAFVANAIGRLNVGIAVTGATPGNEVMAKPVYDDLFLYAGCPPELYVEGDGSGNAGQYVIVSCTPVWPRGAVTRPPFTQFGFYRADVVEGVDFGSAWGKLYGQILPAQRLTIRLTPVNQSGQSGTPLDIPCVL